VSAPCSSPQDDDGHPRRPTATGMSAPPGFLRTWLTIGAESSMPDTATPRAARGRATRPVPTANSSARPAPASSARKFTVGPTTSGLNISGEPSSYCAAVSWSQTSLLVMPTTVAKRTRFCRPTFRERSSACADDRVSPTSGGVTQACFPLRSCVRPGRRAHTRIDPDQLFLSSWASMTRMPLGPRT
jgi:hypothetical protein